MAALPLPQSLHLQSSRHASPKHNLPQWASTALSLSLSVSASEHSRRYWCVVSLIGRARDQGPAEKVYIVPQRLLLLLLLHCLFPEIPYYLLLRIHILAHHLCLFLALRTLLTPVQREPTHQTTHQLVASHLSIGTPKRYEKSKRPINHCG